MLVPFQRASKLHFLSEFSKNNVLLCSGHIYSISQKWVHSSHFCKYFIISFHVTTEEMTLCYNVKQWVYSLYNSVNLTSPQKNSACQCSGHTPHTASNWSAWLLSQKEASSKDGLGLHECCRHWGAIYSSLREPWKTTCTVTFWSRAWSPPVGDWAAAQYPNMITTTALLKKLMVKVMDCLNLSPDLNPIEYLWGILKWKIEERKVSNIHQLHDVIMEEKKRNPVATCEALANSMPKKVKAVL